MASIHNYRSSNISDIVRDKENNSITSNEVLERKLSDNRKFKRFNENLFNPSLPLTDSENLNTANIPTSLSNRSQNESEIMRKINANKVKRLLSFENNVPTSKGSSEKPYHSKHSLIDKDRYSFIDNPKNYYEKSKSSSFIEPLKPIERENKYTAELKADNLSLNKKLSPRNINVEEKVVVVVDLKKQCNNALIEYAPAIMDTIKAKDVNLEIILIYCLEN